MEIFQNLKSIRSSKGVSQADMAERLNIAVNNYSKIERGVTELSINRANQIAEVLGVTLAEILGIEKIMDFEEAEYLKEQNEDLINENKYLRNLTLERKESIIEKYTPYVLILNNIFIQTAFNSAKELGIFNENDIYDFDKHYNFIEKLPFESQKNLYEKIKKIPNMFHAIIDTDVSKTLRRIAIDTSYIDKKYPWEAIE